MFKNLCSDESFIKIYNDPENYPSSESVGKALGYSPASVKNRASALRAKGVTLVDRSSKSVITDVQYRIRNKKLEDEIIQLRKELSDRNASEDRLADVIEVIHSTRETKFEGQSDWLVKPAKSGGVTGIPVINFGDAHHNEVVDPAQIEFMNKYNVEIAEKRIKYTFETTENLLFNYMVNPNYPGIVVNFCGDMVSGMIHEDIRNTNQLPATVALARLHSVLVDGLKFLLKKFKRLQINCVVGNHGRLTDKPSSKNATYDNYEWLLYHFIMESFKDEIKSREVFMNLPTGPDARFSIYNTNFLLNHGDQFRGGSGISGFLSPLTLGMHRKQKKEASMGRPFDIMILGHFHQSIELKRMIVNGCIIGFNEFANRCNFDFERPQQLLFIAHKDRGILYKIPIFCDGYEEKEKKSVPSLFNAGDVFSLFKS